MTATRTATVNSDISNKEVPVLRRSSLHKSSSNGNNANLNRPRRPLSSTAQLSIMQSVVSIWREACFQAKQKDRRVRRHVSLNGGSGHKTLQVSFHPPKPQSQLPKREEQGDNDNEEEEEEEVIHEVCVDIIEFDEEEAVLSLQNPEFVAQDHDEIPWYDQDYEELPWWEYPDLDEDDELTARCKQVLREGGRMKDASDYEFWKAAERIESLVVSFALKLRNRAMFTTLQKQGVEFEDIEISTVGGGTSTTCSATATEKEPDEELSPVETENIENIIAKMDENNHIEEDAEMEEDEVAKAVEEAILEVLGESASKFLEGAEAPDEEPIQTALNVTRMEERKMQENYFEQMKKKQILKLQEDQEEEIQKLLHPATATSETPEPSQKRNSKDLSSILDQQASDVTSHKPRRSSFNDDNASLHSASVFSTGGWSRLNIHNSEMRRYQKNSRRHKKRRNQDRWWADDHTVAFHGTDEYDDEKSVSSFQSSPAMMEYTKTKLSLFRNASGRPRRRGSLDSKDDMSFGKISASSSFKKKAALNLSALPGSGKKKRRKKKNAGQLAMFMAKEKLKQHEESNIFDIIEEGVQQPEASGSHSSPKEGEHSQPEKAVDYYVTRQPVDEDGENEPLPDIEEEAQQVDDNVSPSLQGPATNVLSPTAQENDQIDSTLPFPSPKDQVEEAPRGIQDIVANDVTPTSSKIPGSGNTEEEKNDSQEKFDSSTHEKESADDLNKEVTLYAVSNSDAMQDGHKSDDSEQLENESSLYFESVRTSASKEPSQADSPSSPNASPKKKSRKKARHAMRSDLGYSSMHNLYLPDSGPRRSKTSQLLKQDDHSKSSEDNSVSESRRYSSGPLLARRASFSDIQFEGSSDPSTPAASMDAKFRLVMLRHAAVCVQAQYGGICPSDPACSQMKELLKHMSMCKHQSTTTLCPFPGCSESKSFLLVMHKNSQILAQQREKEKDLPPIISASAKASAEDNDNLSDIDSFGSGDRVADDSEDDDDSMEDVAPSFRHGEDRNSKDLNDLIGKSEHIHHRGSVQRNMQRRTSWTGSVEIKAHQDLIEAREKERLEKAKKEVANRKSRSKMEELERQKSVADLRRRHEEVRARVEKANQEKADAKLLKKIKRESLEVERLETEWLASEQEAKRLQELKDAAEKSKKHQLELQRIKEEARSKIDKIEAEAAKQEVLEKSRLRKEDLERQKSEADLRKRHEEIKARLKGKQDDPKAAIEAIKRRKEQKRRKSVPANGSPSLDQFPTNAGRSPIKKERPKVAKVKTDSQERNGDEGEPSGPVKGKKNRRASFPAKPDDANEENTSVSNARPSTSSISSALPSSMPSPSTEPSSIPNLKPSQSSDPSAPPSPEGNKLRDEFKKPQEIECAPSLVACKTAQTILKKKSTGKTEEQLEIEKLKAAKLAKKEKKKRNSFLGKAKKAFGM